MGLCNDSRISTKSVWLYPTDSIKIIVRLHPWPPDIINALVLETILGRALANSDLELSALIFYNATLLVTFPEMSMTAPRSVLDYIPTISRST